MGVQAPVAEWQVVRPAAPLRGLVDHYVGYRYDGFPPGAHIGLPSRHLTVVVSLDEPTRVVGMPDPEQAPADFPTLASGLAVRPALMRHEGREHGVQLALTPAGARSLLGRPAGALGPAVVGLGELLPGADLLAERLHEEPGWAGRFALLDRVLGAVAGRRAPAVPELEHAWALVVAGGGAARVADVAQQVGWSRRHLAARFTAEYGLSPKQACRVVRFERSRGLLARRDGTRVAEVAAATGYFDQAHLCREWAALAGCSPTSWLAAEGLPSVQSGVDGTGDHGGHDR